MRLANLLASLLLFFSISALTVSAQGEIRVFHSPNDDGTSPPDIVVLSPGSHTLHLYMETGSTASSSGPCDTGDGEEVCQWLIDTKSEGSIDLESFTPAGDVIWNVDGPLLTATGGDYEFGSLGVFKLGDLVISATDEGSVALVDGKVALADLSLTSLETGGIVVVPEPSRWLLLIAGAALLGLLYRRRTRRLRFG